MRKCLAIMFLLLFSFQVVPAKVWGKLLAKAQTDEEVKHSDSSDDAGGDAFNYNDFVPHSSFTITHPVYVINRKVFIVQGSLNLPPSFIAEIPSPPPNPFC